LPCLHHSRAPSSVSVSRQSSSSRTWLPYLSSRYP
jgi:hypothetical protein